LQPFKLERGSAALDFILVAIPLLMVTLAQLSIFSSAFILNVIRDSAVEGARYAALADQSSEQGCARSKSLVAAALGKSLSAVFTCQSIVQDQIALERVSITVNWIGLGALAGLSTLQAESMAPRESVN
jgi:Flp pilus assembly protein TadG